MDRREDSREEPPEDDGREPEDTMSSEAATDVGEAIEATELDDPYDGDTQLVDDPVVSAAGQEDAADEAMADGALDTDHPSRLREEAERLQREAQARQQAAAELREEASKLREEAARLLEQPKELQVEAARLREEASAAQGLFEAEPEVDTAPAPEEAPAPPDQPTTDMQGDRKRGWRRRRRG